MQLIKHLIHKSIQQPLSADQRILNRQTVRGIIIRDDKILLLYTQRYNDFSFPGGGLDEGEDPQHGLVRELSEETGAKSVNIIAPFGKVTEYLPTRKKGWDLMFQISYWYQCQVADVLGQAKPEHYEIANGMSAEWVNILEAIGHNQSIIEGQPATMGLTIERDTLVLRQVACKLMGQGEVRAIA
jgi:ADP-ribose pyrophosphatase YjhB (NUDIX family)